MYNQEDRGTAVAELTYLKAIKMNLDADYAELVAILRYRFHPESAHRAVQYALDFVRKLEVK